MATATAIRPTTTESCDLRDWLKDVKKLEQLEQISGAHWDLEIGALTEIILERISTPPAVIFDQVPGFDPNRRVLVEHARNPGAHRADAQPAARFKNHSFDRCPAREVAGDAADQGERGFRPVRSSKTSSAATKSTS